MFQVTSIHCQREDIRAIMTHQIIRVLGVHLAANNVEKLVHGPTTTLKNRPRQYMKIHAYQSSGLQDLILVGFVSDKVIYTRLIDLRPII